MPISIEFSIHSLIKIEILKSHGMIISKEFVEDIIRNPDKLCPGYKDRLIAQKKVDDEHVVRAVHEKKSEKIFVVTIYPGRRSRYEKD